MQNENLAKYNFFACKSVFNKTCKMTLKNVFSAFWQPRFAGKYHFAFSAGYTICAKKNSIKHLFSFLDE